MKEDIISYLQSGLCEITFTKKDGTERTLVGTLLSDLIPLDHHPKGNDRVHSTDVQPVYEVDLGQWRSFRWDSVVSYSVDI